MFSYSERDHLKMIKIVKFWEEGSRKGRAERSPSSGSTSGLCGIPPQKRNSGYWMAPFVMKSFSYSRTSEGISGHLCCKSSTLVGQHQPQMWWTSGPYLNQLLTHSARSLHATLRHQCRDQIRRREVHHLTFSFPLSLVLISFLSAFCPEVKHLLPKR